LPVTVPQSPINNGDSDCNCEDPVAGARGKTTTYSCDALDRVVLAAYQTGSPSAFQYDGGSSPAPNDIGYLTFFSDESGQSTLSYDPHGRLASLTQVTASAATPAAAQTVSWIYDETALIWMDALSSIPLAFSRAVLA
jgi:YD repeat-containing protein